MLIIGCDFHPSFQQVRDLGESAQLNQRVEQEVAKRPPAVKLQTHPGVGPVTALAMVLTLGASGAVSFRQASGKLLRTDSQ